MPQGYVQAKKADDVGDEEHGSPLETYLGET
jgi:hypothetical protein